MSSSERPSSSSGKPRAPTPKGSVQSLGCKVRGPWWTDGGAGDLDYAFLESPNPTAPLRQGNEPGEKMVTVDAQSRIPEVADPQHQETASEKPSSSTSTADLDNAPRESFLPNKRKEEADGQEFVGLKPADTLVANGAEAYGVDQRSPRQINRHPPRALCHMSSPSPGESEDTTAFGFAEVIGRNIRRGKKTGITPRDFDLSSLGSPSLIAAVPKFPELPSPHKVTTASAEDSNSKELRTSHQKFPEVLPTLPSSAHSEKVPRLRIPPNKEKEPTNGPDLDSLVPAYSPVANGGEESCGIDQRSPQQISRHASRSSPEHAEDSTGLYFLRLIGRNITCRRRTGITSCDLDLSSLESPSPAAAVPEISDLASAQMVTRATGQEKSSHEVGTASQKAPDEPPTLASRTDSEKGSHASFARSKENEPAAMTGLGGMGPSTHPAATIEPVPGVDQGNSRPTKRQGAKTSRRRGARRETSEDGTTSSVASSTVDGESVARSTSGRPLRSAAIGKNYRESDI
ncbi:uncharacterized protein LOC144131991 isoform X1 [Amblyomma americanum]